jgi:hypothetical protein
LLAALGHPRLPQAIRNYPSPFITPYMYRQPGATVPVKFDLGGDQGLNVLAAGYPRLQPVFCGTTTPSGAAVTPTRTTGLRYDPATRQYLYPWSTSRDWRGTCGRLDLRLNDGTTHSAFFSFA